jgi:dGTPase
MLGIKATMQRDKGMSGARASYAADATASRGRLYREAPSPTRTPFERDRDRIVHSTAFRRLAHKTQVFVHHEGDHFRTRLTHTIEVAQIARALAKALGLDQDLAEAVALGHDLGHTPFGHTGEDALDACMAPFGGFDHNGHGLRIVTALERRYANFDGLNLTQETLEGLVKHNGPLIGADGQPLPRWRARGIPKAILDYDARQSLDLELFASLEAQAAAIADDIAYNAHDMDDGLRAGLFDLEAAHEVAFVGQLLDEVAALHPGLERPRVIHELGRRIITRFIEDVIAESRGRIGESGVQRINDVRRAGRTLVGFSRAFESADAQMKRFLFANMYRHASVKSVREKADRVVRRLFAAFFETPDSMPRDRAAAAAGASDLDRARLAADYIAGMTDRFAIAEHTRIFDEAPDLR